MNRTFWLLLLAVIVAIYSDKCSSAEVTPMLGVASFQKPSDGLYWNYNQPNSFQLNPIAAAVRVDSAPIIWNTSIGLQYTWFGTVKADAWAVSQDAPRAGGYIAGAGACMGSCASLGRWLMSTETQGIALLATKHIGNWSFEAGANLYETRTKGHVLLPGQDWQYKEGRYLGLGPVVGAAYRIGPVSVHLQLWRMEGKGSDGDPYVPPAVFNESHQWTLLAGYSF
jgi:hypothetical protein